jgi:hypothetical protein
MPQRPVFNDPNYAGLFEIWQTVEVPRFVKEAAVAEDQDFAALPFDNFAHPAARMYPLNNRSNTWLSREYFGKDRPQYAEKLAEEIDRRIRKAASFWKLDEPKRLAATPYPPVYTIVIEDEAVHEKLAADGISKVASLEPVRRSTVEIRTPEHYRQAAEGLLEKRASWSYAMRSSLATGLLDAPPEMHAELPEDLDEYLHKAAGLGTCTAREARDAVYGRMCVARGKNEPIAESLCKIAAHLSGLDGSLPADKLHKVAKVLDLADHALGLHREYGKGQALPEEQLFRITERTVRKIAEEAVALSNGQVLSRAELRKQAAKVSEFFRSRFDEVPYSSDDEMIDVVQSLPRPDATALTSYLGSLPDGD